MSVKSLMTVTLAPTLIAACSTLRALQPVPLVDVNSHSRSLLDLAR